MKTQRNGSNCSGLNSQTFIYLVVAEDSLFAEAQVVNNEHLRAAVVEVPSKCGTALLHMQLI